MLQVRNMPDAATFQCPNCEAQYKSVRVAALRRMTCQLQRRRFVRVRTPTDGKRRDAKPGTCAYVGVFDESSIWRHRRRRLLS
jgi:hypothetical protein